MSVCFHWEACATDLGCLLQDVGCVGEVLWQVTACALGSSSSSSSSTIRRRTRLKTCNQRKRLDPLVTRHCQLLKHPCTNKYLKRLCQTFGATCFAAKYHYYSVKKSSAVLLCSLTAQLMPWTRGAIGEIRRAAGQAKLISGCVKFSIKWKCCPTE